MTHIITPVWLDIFFKCDNHWCDMKQHEHIMLNKLFDNGINSPHSQYEKYVKWMLVCALLFFIYYSFENNQPQGSNRHKSICFFFGFYTHTAKEREKKVEKKCATSHWHFQSIRMQIYYSHLSLDVLFVSKLK